MVTMNDIIAFIERAMERNLIISTMTRGEYSVIIHNSTYNSDKDYIMIQFYPWSDKDCIDISMPDLDTLKIKVSEMDLALFKVEVLKAREYSKNKVIEAFNSFFEEDKKVSDINDLDDEE